MKLYWARFKDYKNLPERYKCCEANQKKLRELQGKLLLVDVEDRDQLAMTACGTCGHLEQGKVQGVAVIHSDEAKDMVNWRIDVNTLDLDDKPAEVVWPIPV